MENLPFRVITFRVITIISSSILSGYAAILLAPEAIALNKIAPKPTKSDNSITELTPYDVVPATPSVDDTDITPDDEVGEGLDAQPSNATAEEANGDESRPDLIEVEDAIAPEQEAEESQETSVVEETEAAAAETTAVEEAETGDSIPHPQSEIQNPDDELTAEQLERRQLLIEGDRLFLEGRLLEAEERYRQAKDPFELEEDLEHPDAFSEPDQLSPAGQVYWREYQAGLELGLDSRTLIPLELLVETQPEFIPGHLAYAQRLTEAEETDEALRVLEQANALYPNDRDLTVARVDALVADKQWLQAAIASRQFALLNPEDPEVATFEIQAEEYQDRFRSKMRRRLTRTAIGNVITGALGFAVTGSWFGPLSAVETTILMLRGESAVGERAANQAMDELDLIDDEAVLEYVDEIGQELATLAGRDEFDYQFYVIAEDELNAFALPGGKIFVNAGAITRTETGAELAGLIAHELAHAVLSHGFQLVTRGNLTANLLQFVPYGGLATNLTVLSYSRDMERQADRFGTQLLATSPYAADGLRNLMETLWEESENRSRFDWLSTHPDTPERIRNLERLIEQNGYNRYAFEDIERHLMIREQVEAILIEMGKIEVEEPNDETRENGEASENEEPEIEGSDEGPTEAEEQEIEGANETPTEQRAPTEQREPAGQRELRLRTLKKAYDTPSTGFSGI
ncbi:MAG: M48 family metalloprotease [Merismopedia sp. SIO2A8]|nr:M48 family metalloprotease [Merismopedia sp. SIO2A8]